MRKANIANAYAETTSPAAIIPAIVGANHHKPKLKAVPAPSIPKPYPKIISFE